MTMSIYQSITIKSITIVSFSPVKLYYKQYTRVHEFSMNYKREYKNHCDQ